MDLSIRRMCPADLDTVTKIEAACFPPAEAAKRETMARRIAAFPHSFLIAELEGAPAGLINGFATSQQTITDDLFADASLHNPDGAYQSVFGLCVLPEYQRRGIAAQLMRAFCELARADGRKGVILTCKQHLIPYYERFGFENLGVSQSVHGGAVWYDLLLRF